VIAVGGDGTIHEVVNGIMGSEKALGVVPVGSGNDLIKSVRIPGDFRHAVRCSLSGKLASIDVGRVEVSREGAIPGNSSPSYFVNGLGIGFDAEVAARTKSVNHASGMLLYVVSVFRTMGKYRSPEFFVSVDGRQNQSRNLLIAIGNGRCSGGGFYLTPRAKPDDGLLDICSIDEISSTRILGIMPSVMKGNHMHKPCVRMERGRRIEVKTSRAVVVHSDGEILGTDIIAVLIQVVPHALNVIVE
jgi:YegS/Rv2252/BmrU family lipid kinase